MSSEVLPDDAPGQVPGQVPGQEPGQEPGQAAPVAKVLRRQLSTLPLVAVIYFSVSGGPFGLEEGIGGSGPGMALVALIIVPIIFAVPCALMAAELGSAIPVEGGYYYWVKLAMGNFAAFTEGIWQWLNSFLDTALYPVIFVDYMAVWIPWMKRGHDVFFSAYGGRVSFDVHWLVAIVFMIVLAWLNIRGSRLVADTGVVMMALILLPFVVVSVLGLVRIFADGAGSTLHPFTLPHQSVWSSFGAGLGVMIWNYIGWDAPSTVLAEVDRPQRTYTRALMISVPLITISYLLPMIGALGSGLHQGHADRWYDGDFAVAGGMLGGHWLKLAITIGAVLSQVGLFSSLLMSGSRVPRVLAGDGYLPRVLARDGRHGTPVGAIVISCVIFSLFCALDFETLLDADVLTNLAAIMLEFAAFLVLRRTMASMDRPFRVPGGWPVAGLITLGPAALTVYLAVSTLHDEAGAFWIGVVILVLGLALYPVCKRFIKGDRPDAEMQLGE
jgi:amino acid transporter